MRLRHLFYKNKKRKNKVILHVLGIPVYVKKYDNKYAYYSLFGIRIIKKRKEKIQQEGGIDLRLDRNVCNVAILLNGGLGDQLINANFIYLLRQKIKNKQLRIDIYEPRNLSHAIFKEGNYVDHIYSEQHPKHNQYDLSIELSRFPILRNVNKRRIPFLCPELYEMVQIWEKDNVEKYRFIDFNPRLDGLLNKYYLLKGYKRWEQFDIDHKLGMTESFPTPMFIDISEKDYLKRLKLPAKFITIHRGVDVRADAGSVKQWPVKYYNELIGLIRTKYPKVFIVQLGDSKERCPEFDGISLNLSGETTLEELKVLLKHSFLHIDNEGGMVHLRHALQGGQSIVLFGPTDPNVYGYTENTNLIGKGCIGGCEWIHEHWQKECALGAFCPPCQYSLKPDVVFKHFMKIMGK